MKAISQSLLSFSLLRPPSTCSCSCSCSSSLSTQLVPQFDQSLVNFFMDSAQWPQEIGLLKPMEEPAASSAGGGAAVTGHATSSSAASRPPQAAAAGGERRARPHKEQVLSCPRCNSTNTKFCYYNNYSLTQPRYFCKTCRRYWTEGGSLRNVPVGGGSRKNKRSSLSSSSSSAAAVSSSIASKKLATTDHHHLIPPPISLSNTSQAPKFLEGQDLNLAFPHHSHQMPEFGDFPSLEISNASTNGGTSNSRSALSAMQLLSSGIAGRGLGPFMSMPVAAPEYPSGFALQDFRPPTLSFSLDGMVTGAAGGGGGSSSVGYSMMQESSGAGSSLLFPFEDLKPPSNAAADQEQFDQQINRGQSGDPPGFWSGVIGGGSSW